MPFVRVWDASCPRVWARWQDAAGAWRVQDLPPGDDARALDLIVDVMLRDEALCTAQNCASDEASVRGARRFWAQYLARRCSLACYREDGGVDDLVAVNALYVKGADDVQSETYEGAGWRRVLAALDHVEAAADSWAAVGGTRALYGLGLAVRPDQRGRRLGQRLLDAREPFCRALGVPATVTVFTGPASQRLAAAAGFRTVAVRSLADLAAAGLPYPADPARVLKTMVKTYDE